MDWKERIEACLQAYRKRYPEEDRAIARFEDLLSKADSYSRESYPAHFTASSWIVDPTLSKCLLVFHPKLLKWLQPGGHLEGRELPWDAAYREVKEEVGVFLDFAEKIGEIVVPLDLDCHLILAKGDQKEHLHYDFRFLGFVEENAKIGTEEGIELKWFDLGKISGMQFELSIERMAKKTSSFAIRT